MLTSRGWWFLIIVASLLTLGAFDEQPGRGGRGQHWTLILVSLTLLLWFLSEWLLFALRVRLVLPFLRVRRQVSEERGPVDTLWAGRSFHIRVQLELCRWGNLPHVQAVDPLPFGIELRQGKTTMEGAFAARQRQELGYTIHCSAAGKVRFEGIGIQLADLQGFFHHATFIPDVVEYRVLPPLADAEGRQPTVKRHNLLPTPGLHRHLRPGSGSELLDLRDYLPGDPPKRIAWKVSARRDRLVTKEFESEVPVRCTLFLDTAHSVRLGPPGQNALARMVEIGAAVAQANAGARDPTGICLFDEQRVTRYFRPARGARSLVQLLNILADTAGLAPTTDAGHVNTLLPLAYAFAEEVYPYLLQPELNPLPSWSTWLWPVPTYSAGSRSFLRLLLGGLIFLLASVPFLSMGLFLYLFSDSLPTLLAALADAFVPVPEGLQPIIGVALVASLLLLYYSTVQFAYRALGLWFRPRKRRLARWRKRLAAILAERYDLAPGGLALLLEDDAHFSLAMQQFLAEHHVPYALPLYDRRGRYRFASPGKIDVLSQALVRAVGKGQDNELFVLLVDLLELVDKLEPLLRAVKMTLARHHQVLVICPWPPGVPVPTVRRSVRTWERERTTVADRAPSPALSLTHSPTLIRQATIDQLHRAFERLRRTFVRLGVPVICADSGDPVRLILDRLDRLRILGGRR